MSRLAAALLCVMACAAPAESQELAVSASIYRPLGIDDLDGELPPSAEIRFTIRLSDRFGLEPFVSVGWPDRSAGTQGFYGAQIRQRIVGLTSEDVYAFATYGAAAYYSRYGSQSPVIGHFGFGIYRRVSRQLAFRPEVQLVSFHVIPIGVRFLAGLSADLGR